MKTERQLSPLRSQHIAFNFRLKFQISFFFYGHKNDISIFSPDCLYALYIFRLEFSFESRNSGLIELQTSSGKFNFDAFCTISFFCRHEHCSNVWFYIFDFGLRLVKFICKLVFFGKENIGHQQNTIKGIFIVEIIFAY